MEARAQSTCHETPAMKPTQGALTPQPFLALFAGLARTAALGDAALDREEQPLRENEAAPEGHRCGLVRRQGRRMQRSVD